MKLKKYILIILLLIVPMAYIIFRAGNTNPDIGNTLVFQQKLSDYGLFQGRLRNLQPAGNVEIFELSSTLFTDHAEKQRLIRLPKGTKLSVKGDELPDFPEGTLLAKTFYYETSGDERKIIETRILILSASKWNVATYKWNDAQDEAFLIEDGATVAVRTKDADARTIQLSYRIPGQKECISCHRSGNSILPIGPKIRNLNRSVTRNDTTVNQLVQLMRKGLIHQSALTSLKMLPDYRDINIPVVQRARAYMEINCAHCHRPGGYAGQTTINLDYASSLERSGILLHKNNIIMRMSQMGEYHMPKLGTTMIDQEGLQLVSSYIEKLK